MIKPPVRLLIVDDLPTARFVVRSYLSRAEDVEVVGESETGEGAVAGVALLHPDVVVMDVEMPGIGGVEATRRIRRDFPETRVVGFSYSEDGSLASLMRAAGASSFIPKGSPMARLLNQIREWSGSTDSS